MKLTKTKFKMGMECPKKLWLSEFHPEVFPEDRDEQIIQEGIEVGKLAGELFVNPIVIPYATADAMYRETNKQLAAGETVIAEATFIHDNLSCSVDYFEVEDDGVVINEVKAKTSVRKIRTKNGEKYDAELLPEYLYDAAFQYYVLTHAGYKVNRVNYILLNGSYHRGDSLIIEDLFWKDDVTEEVVKYAKRIENDINYLLSIISSTDTPENMLKLACKSSTKECTAWHYCGKDIPKNSIWDLAGVGRKEEWIQDGTITMGELLNRNALNKKMRQQVEVEFSGATIINVDALRGYLDSLNYPLYFFDFESYMDAVPKFEKQWPYEQVTFQYSLDVIEHPGAAIEHKEFLGEEGEDPREKLVEQLLSDIPNDGGSIIVYHADFEKNRLNELAELFPLAADRLLDMVCRLRDMEIPFKNRDYYIKEMQGRSSIKVVLPALYPDEPSLDYTQLPGVQKGDQAAAMFKQLAKLADEERTRQRKYMLQYCGLDTFALIKVYEKLLEVINDEKYEAIKKACNEYSYSNYVI